MVSVDTNVLIRITAQDNPQQYAASEEFISRNAWVSHVVLVEAIWVLGSSYNRTHADLVQAIEILLSHENLVLQEDDVVRASLALFKANPRLGFSDCMILEIARKAGHVPLGTFDRGLAKLGGAQKL